MINNDQQEKQSDLDSLWDQWKQAWQDLQGRDFNKQKSQSLFIMWFQKAYTEADKERESNKTQNFMYKRQFLVLLRIAIIVQIILAVSILVPCTFDYLSKRMVYIEVFLLSILVLFAIIIAKKMDIYKYQETWSRHARFQYLWEQEMLRFLFHMDPYRGSSQEKTDNFIKAVLAIEEQNINKFCENMDTKEKGILDELSNLIPKRGK